MSYELINRLKGPSTLLVNDGAVTVALANLSSNTGTENVNFAYITSMKWSVASDAGNILVTRNSGSGTNVVANLHQSGDWKHDELSLSNTATGNLTVTITGGGTLIMSLKKDCTYNVDTQFL